MNTLLENRCHRPAALPLRAAADAWRALDRRFSGCAAAWRRHRDARATAQALGRLDDRTLSDLGFHRSELSSIAHNPRDATRAHFLWL